MSKQQVQLKEKVINAVELILFIVRLLCILAFFVCIITSPVPDEQRVFFGMLAAFSVGGIILTSIILWVIELITNG